MLPLVAHISRRGKGETNGKQEAPAPASPAKPAAAASPAAGAGRAGWDWLQQLSVAVSPSKPAKPDAMEAPPVKDASTGEAFPAAQRFWRGGELRCLGAGVRVKKLGGLLPVKIYSVALYADAHAAKGAVGRHAADSAAAATALQGGGFSQALQIRLVRSITGKQFTDALDESLRPLMRGDEGVLDQFCAFFAGAQLAKGAEVTLLWRTDGATDVCLRPPGEAAAYSAQKPGLNVASRALGSALWRLYLGEAPPALEARNAWLAALPAL